MKCDLAYVLLTPYTIARSRTGGVLSRLLVRLDLELVGAQMIAPTAEQAKIFAQSELDFSQKDDFSAKLKHDYILKTFTPSQGRRHRVLLLLFKGPDAVTKLANVAGPIFPDCRNLESVRGESIRDTYGDILSNETNPKVIEYFEPVVFTPNSDEHCIKNLGLLLNFLKDEPNLIENMTYENPESIERTLVIIKPDNWIVPSSRPGTIIDMFSRTGLRVIGTKIHQMSIAEALEFYGPVEGALIEKLGPKVGENAVKELETKFSVSLPKETAQSISTCFGEFYARDQFYQIIGFMTGIRPEFVDSSDHKSPGKSKCMVIVYEGHNAVTKIREVLGPTDPLKAPAGTIRREFGSNVMVNTAHASDSAENAKREMSILKIDTNKVPIIIEQYLQNF